MDKYKFVERLLLPIFNLKYRFKKYKNITPFNTFDLKKSLSSNPHTGMDRQQWLLSAEYLLNGIFKYVKQIGDPLFFPKQQGKSYPKIIRSSKKTAFLEGLCRTLFIAAPVLKDNPNHCVNNVPVATYYQDQLAQLTQRDSPIFIEDRKVNYPSQYLVEFGSLAMVFFLCKETLWVPLSQEVKDKLASKMLSYGEGPYVDNNWKYFSLFILSFFKSEGYSVDEKRIELLLSKITEDYSGDGWYLDDSYDYYSMWGYQLYAAIWSTSYGEKYHPEIAHTLKNNFKDMLHFYPYLFARNGKMLMWGRSITYRFGAVAPFLFASWIDKSEVNMGWLRRISSGAVLQFLENKDFLKFSIPTLGFYGAFEPCIQSYSCRASSFWFGKSYLGLTLPPNNAFWLQQENDGPWEHYEKNSFHHYFSKQSNILATHYANSGATEIKTCTPKSILKAGAYMRNENYNRLAYHTGLPWQEDTVDGCVAMNYLIKDAHNAWEPLRQYDFVSYEDDVLRRQVSLETYLDTHIQLEDIQMPNGVLRIDRIHTSGEKEIRLGHYALPEKKIRIKESTLQTNQGIAHIYDNGEYQLLGLPLLGWQNCIVLHQSGLHPESKKSTVLNLLATIQKDQVFITLLLVKKSGEDWESEELECVENLQLTETSVTFTLKHRGQYTYKY